MTVAQDHARDVFIAAGLVAYDAGVLPAALAELAVRLEVKGAGELLDQLCRLDWTEPRDAKTDPKPVPTPKQPPPPPPPPPTDGVLHPGPHLLPASTGRRAPGEGLSHARPGLLLLRPQP